MEGVDCVCRWSWCGCVWIEEGVGILGGCGGEGGCMYV